MPSVVQRQGERTGVWRRRLLSVGGLVLIWHLVILVLPLLLGGAICIDLLRRARGNRAWGATRLLGVLLAYVSIDLVGLLLLFASWLRAQLFYSERDALLKEDAFVIQRLWTGTLFALISSVYNLRVTVEGGDVVKEGPYVLYVRHTSLLDTLLPAVCIANRWQIRLRYVLKEELLLKPCLDVAGLRMPNCFLRRESGAADQEIERLRMLAKGLEPNEAVLIYPEGTRFTKERQQRARERLAQRDEKLLALALELERVLPPRTGGPLALLDAGHDVVICSHVGLDGFARVGDFFRGEMVGQRLKIRFERIPASEIPGEREARVRWLFETWKTVDEWVKQQEVMGAQEGTGRRDGLTLNAEETETESDPQGPDSAVEL